MLFIVLTCCHTTSSVHWYRAVLIVAISVGRPNTPDSRQQVHVTFVLITCCRRCLIEMLLCPVRPCCRAICIVGHCPPARPCHWFCCHFKGRGQKARHLRQGGVRHGPLSPRAEWRHDAGRRCQNRLIDPELEYAAITNNDLKSPASVDSDLPAPAGAVGGGANKMGTVKESKEGALTQSGPHGDKRFSQTMRPTKRSPGRLVERRGDLLAACPRCLGWLVERSRLPARGNAVLVGSPRRPARTRAASSSPAVFARRRLSRVP